MNEAVAAPAVRDTPAWILQVWASFLIALLAACIGIYYLPVPPWIQGYATMGLFFMIGSTFTLAKTIRDNRFRQTDTPAWVLQVWASFLISLFLLAVGVYQMPADLWIKGYIGIGAFLVLATSFTLSKTIRDNHEATRIREAAQAMETQAPEAVT
jgi:hypothetical protein